MDRNSAETLSSVEAVGSCLGVITFIRSLTFSVVCLLAVQGTAAAMQPCESPEVSGYDFIFIGEPTSSTVLQDLMQKMKDDLINKEGEWNDETIEIWFGKPTITKFKILETYKGDLQKEVDIFHASKSIAGIDFPAGHKYLLYANKEEGDVLKKHGGLFSVGHCTAEIVDDARPSDMYLRAKAYKAQLK